MKIAPDGKPFRIERECRHHGLTEFAYEYRLKTEKTKGSYACIQCRLDRSKVYRRNAKVELVQYKGGKCIVCGYNKCNAALDFHHLDPSKKDFAISDVKGSKSEAIRNEVDKCVLLCKNCHSEFHAGEIDLSKFI